MNTPCPRVPSLSEVELAYRTRRDWLEEWREERGMDAVDTAVEAIADMAAFGSALVRRDARSRPYAGNPELRCLLYEAQEANNALISALYAVTYPVVES